MEQDNPSPNVVQLGCFVGLLMDSSPSRLACENIRKHFEETRDQCQADVMGLFSELHELHNDSVQTFSLKGFS